MKVSIIIGQIPTSFKIEENLLNINKIIDKANKDDLVILPEGALSGYDDDISFLKNIDLDELNIAMNKLKQKVIDRKIHIIFGSCIYEGSYWYNAAIGYSYCNDDYIYRKVNLATHEREVFKSGNKLPVYEIRINKQSLKLGIQLCREIRYPEQWKVLALNGAEIFIYLTNAVNINQSLSVWRSHLVSRAAENQRFLVSSNVASKHQHCPTLLIHPNGKVISEIISDELNVIKTTVDTGDISNWFLNQSMNEIVSVKYKFVD